ncbi:UNVERIFIED_CONTAM: hypothetical protein PYX00_002044 [Menopon gallinae]|uniref:Uncharacterized protein n=1 Tax=Menopon gallinae TaxID=328185 RepID=A0AAW2IGH0_9NEOP
MLMMKAASVLLTSTPFSYRHPAPRRIRPAETLGATCPTPISLLKLLQVYLKRG